jgi:hypothetical protein
MGKASVLRLLARFKAVRENQGLRLADVAIGSQIVLRPKQVQVIHQDVEFTMAGGFDLLQLRFGVVVHLWGLIRHHRNVENSLPKPVEFESWTPFCHGFNLEVRQTVATQFVHLDDDKVFDAHYSAVRAQPFITCLYPGIDLDVATEFFF